MDLQFDRKMFKKMNEITENQKLLNFINIKEYIIMIDAMKHKQKS